MAANQNDGALLFSSVSRHMPSNRALLFTIFESLGLRPQLLDFHVKKGSGPLPNQNKPNQCTSLDIVTEIFFRRCGFKSQPGVKQIQKT